MRLGGGRGAGCEGVAAVALVTVLDTKVGVGGAVGGANLVGHVVVRLRYAGKGARAGTFGVTTKVGPHGSDSGLSCVDSHNRSGGGGGRSSCGGGGCRSCGASQCRASCSGTRRLCGRGCRRGRNRRCIELVDIQQQTSSTILGCVAITSHAASRRGCLGRKRVDGIAGPTFAAIFDTRK